MKKPQQYKVTCQRGIVRLCQIDEIIVLSKLSDLETKLRVYVDTMTWRTVHADEIISIERIPSKYEGLTDGYYWASVNGHDDVVCINDGYCVALSDESSCHIRELPNDTIKEIYVNERIERPKPLARHHGQHEASE